MKDSTQKKKFGCIRVILLIVVAWIATSFIGGWYHQRPKQMLSRFLNTEWSESITRIETSYVGGMDYTAYIYLEGDPSFLRAIVEKNKFKRSGEYQDDPMVIQLDFDHAPQVIAKDVQSYRGIGSGSPMECIAISEDGRQLWYGAFDY